MRWIVVKHTYRDAFQDNKFLRERTTEEDIKINMIVLIHRIEFTSNNKNQRQKHNNHSNFVHGVRLNCGAS